MVTAHCDVKARFVVVRSIEIMRNTDFPVAIDQIVLDIGSPEGRAEKYFLQPVDALRYDGAFLL